MVKNLNTSHDIIKVLEENAGRKISDNPCTNIFINMSPQPKDIKERVNKWNYIELKSFCTAKENISKMKREQTMWENISESDTWDKGLMSKIYKKTHTTPHQEDKESNLKNGWRTWANPSPRRTYRGPRDIWKDAQYH